MSTVRKSAQHYCRALISIKGRRINYKYIIATNSLFHVCYHNLQAIQYGRELSYVTLI